jgi:hypothetical protein
MPANKALQTSKLVTEPIEIVQGSPHVSRKGFTGRGKPHAALQPIKQDGSNLLLKIENAPVERGGCNVQGLGRAADRAMANDGVEIDIEPRRTNAPGDSG